MVVKLNILLSTWDVVYEHWLEAWQCEVVRVVQSYQGLEGLQVFRFVYFGRCFKLGRVTMLKLQTTHVAP